MISFDRVIRRCMGSAKMEFLYGRSLHWRATMSLFLVNSCSIIFQYSTLWWTLTILSTIEETRRVASGRNVPEWNCSTKIIIQEKLTEILQIVSCSWYLQSIYRVIFKSFHGFNSEKNHDNFICTCCFWNENLWYFWIVTFLHEDTSDRKNTSYYSAMRYLRVPRDRRFISLSSHYAQEYSNGLHQ